MPSIISHKYKYFLYKKYSRLINSKYSMRVRLSFHERSIWLILFAVGDAVVVLDLVCVPEDFGKPLALDVRVIPEVEEQCQKRHAIQEGEVNEDGVLVGAILH